MKLKEGLNGKQKNQLEYFENNDESEAARYLSFLRLFQLVQTFGMDEASRILDLALEPHGKRVIDHLEGRIEIICKENKEAILDVSYLLDDIELMRVFETKSHFEVEISL